MAQGTYSQTDVVLNIKAMILFHVMLDPNHYERPGGAFFNEKTIFAQR